MGGRRRGEHGGCLLPALEKGVLVLGVKGVAGEHEGLAGGGGEELVPQGQRRVDLPGGLVSLSKSLARGVPEAPPPHVLA